MKSSEDILIKLQDLSYKPVGAETDVLKDINLEIRKGDFILLLGAPGSGKTMLTHCFNGLIPNIEEGELRGTAIVGGMETSEHEIFELASIVGMVFQNPDDQIVSLKVINEVSWGVENQGLLHEEIVERVDEYLKLLDIWELKDRLTFAISGGQKQKVSIASNLAMLQEILILDDPTTDLDPVCKGEVVQVLSHIHGELGKTLVVIEHDLNDLIELATRMIVMRDGSVAYDGMPEELLSNHYEEFRQLGINIPQHVEIAHKVSQYSNASPSCPAMKKEAFERLQAFITNHSPAPAKPKEDFKPSGEPVISIRDLEFAYRRGIPVLRGINLDIYQGEFVAIIGANGSGKSTLVKALTGLISPDEGRVVVCGNETSQMKIAELAQDLGYVFQNPDDQLFTVSVAEEVAFSLHIRKVPEDEVTRRVDEVLNIVDLAHVRDNHPFSLSRGQRQKLAVATALIHKPSVILLDEPTTGQDRHSLAGLLGMMGRLNQEGNTTIMITHDMDIVAAYATRVFVMVDGQFLLDGGPAEIFYDQFEILNELNLRPPTVIDFCRRLEDKNVPRCLTCEELINYIEEVAIYNNVIS